MIYLDIHKTTRYRKYQTIQSLTISIFADFKNVAKKNKKIIFGYSAILHNIFLKIKENQVSMFKVNPDYVILAVFLYIPSLLNS